LKGISKPVTFGGTIVSKIPFRILPSSGYKNSQFQIISSVDNLRINFILDGNIHKTIIANSSNPTVLLQLDIAGKYVAKSEFEGETYEQHIEVVDALRLGSSTLKKTFLFDEANISFFLMKDRLHMYDHLSGAILTENHFSPSDIVQMNKDNFLFITRISSLTSGIVNLGLYNIDSYSLKAELLNRYREIKIIPGRNIAWLHDKLENSIICFELLSKSGQAFTQIRKLEKFSSYELSVDQGMLFIHFEECITAINLENLFQLDISKDTNTAIDRHGNVFLVLEKTIECHNEFEDLHLNAEFDGRVNLDANNYLHVGENLKGEVAEEGFRLVAAEIMDRNVLNKPENGDTYNFPVTGKDAYSQTSISHSLLAIKSGILLHVRTSIKTLQSVTFHKIQNSWSAIPNTQTSTSYNITKLIGVSRELLFNSSTSEPTFSRTSDCFIINTNNQKIIINGSEKLTLDKSTSYYFLEEADNTYLLVREKTSYTLYASGNFDIPLLNGIQVYNLSQIKEHGIIWYSGSSKDAVSGNSYLKGFILSHCTSFQVDETKAQHSIYKDSADYTFREKYILSSNKIVINPRNGEIFDSSIGSIISISPDLTKLLSSRDRRLYLSVYDTTQSKYTDTEIDLEESVYGESYLSPNGRFLVLQKERDEYLWYDIEKGVKEKFLSGKFIAFSKEGNLVMEEDGTRSVKILDPTTFADITPPNYHHYRFMSPDGALHAQVTKPLVRHYHRIEGNELSSHANRQVMLNYDLSISAKLSNTVSEGEFKNLKRRIDANKKEYFLSNETKLRKKGIQSYHKISYESLVKREQYIKIGIIGTEVTSEIILPSDLDYYNYASFSYDNRYFGYVGKPHSNGLIHLFKLDYDRDNETLEVTDSYITRFPRYASWVCGFSKTGYFATYDSTPDTYIVKVTDQLFKSQMTDQFIRNNLVTDDSRIIRSFKTWHEIQGKNYLCFSPTGKFIAVSEQGYEPLTLGGYGHLESNAVHIALTESGEIVDSFTAHGDSIKQDKVNKVTFVAFSEDERMIMTLSNDGVVVVRGIDIQ
jgi:hypothetical protein